MQYLAGIQVDRINSFKVIYSAAHRGRVYPGFIPPPGQSDKSL